MNIQKQNALFMPIVSRVFSDYMGTQFFPSESLMIDDNDDLKVKNILKNCYLDDKVNNLYIHIPFCKSKCYYCHCFKYISNDKTFYDKYLDYLEKEIQIHRSLNWKKISVDSIFIGWGTPNILNLSQFERLFKMIDDNFNRENCKQFNIDLNPYTYENGQIEIMKKYWLDRCTYAIQSLNRDILNQNYRYNSLVNHSENIKKLKDSGIEVNVDLMIWIEWQTFEICTSDIEWVLKMAPDNISLNYFIQSDNVDYLIDDEKLKLIDDVKKKYNKYIYNEFNKTENYQEWAYLRYERVNLIWIWAWAISHIFEWVSFTCNDIEKYFEFIEKWEIPAFKVKFLDKKWEWLKYLWKNIVFWIDYEHFESFFGVSVKELFPYEMAYLYKKWVLKNRWKYIVSNLSDRETYINFWIFFKDILPEFYKKNEINLPFEINRLKKFFINSWEKLDEDYS